METSDASFAATQISPHLGVSPEGYLVCIGVPIARTAIRKPQMYAAHELGLAGDELMRVYRLEDEVFSDVFLSSLEGKPLVSPHPGEFVDSSNFQNSIKGVCTNVRRGPRKKWAKVSAKGPKLPARRWRSGSRAGLRIALKSEWIRVKIFQRSAGVQGDA